MGNRDKGHRETKKPKKSVKKPQVSLLQAAPVRVDVVPKKRKGDQSGED